MACARVAVSNRTALIAQQPPPEVTEPLRPATNVREGKPARTRTRTREVGARDAPGYTTGLRKRTTRIERASPEWRSGALPTELHPRGARPAGIEPASSAFAEQRSSAELRAYKKEPPAGVEPAP